MLPSLWEPPAAYDGPIPWPQALILIIGVVFLIGFFTS